jgi:hypothetical protein
VAITVAVLGFSGCAVGKEQYLDLEREARRLMMVQ